MKFKKEHAGKWVASKNGKVVETSKKLKPLMNTISKRPDKNSIKYDLVPRGLITGASNVI